jgi:hypothetical protein
MAKKACEHINDLQVKALKETLKWWCQRYTKKE